MLVFMTAQNTQTKPKKQKFKKVYEGREISKNTSKIPQNAKMDKF